VSAKYLVPAGLIAAAALGAVQTGPAPASITLTPVAELSLPAAPITRDDAPSDLPAVPDDAWRDLTNGITIADLQLGDGAPVGPGDRAVFDQAVWRADGVVAHTSWTTARPQAAEIGAGHALPGVETALVGMRPGGRRIARVPAAQAYGSFGTTGVPADTDIVVLLHLRAVGAPRRTPANPPQIPAERLITLEDGVAVVDLDPGTGVAADVGLTAVVELTLWSAEGAVIESSFARGQATRLRLGERRVLPAIEAAILGLKPGARRIVVVQPHRIADPTVESKLPADGPLTVELRVVDVVASPPI
jgi:FKBP-type peptidyl-prolyl cis-trans isomerase